MCLRFITTKKPLGCFPSPYTRYCVADSKGNRDRGRRRSVVSVIVLCCGLGKVIAEKPHHYVSTRPSFTHVPPSSTTPFDSRLPSEDASRTWDTRDPFQYFFMLFSAASHQRGMARSQKNYFRSSCSGQDMSHIQRTSAGCTLESVDRLVPTSAVSSRCV